MDYEVIRSRRKTMCAEIRNGRLIIRAPLRASEAEIGSFIRGNLKWIGTHLAKSQAREEARSTVRRLSDEEIRTLAERALKVIPERAAYYAPLVGVQYGRITIRNQRSRWGSCSSKGNLNFNCLLMLTPPEVLDSVVVHELCHLKEMNHSKSFYGEVLRVFPEYRKWQKWLKDNGDFLMASLDR